MDVLNKKPSKKRDFKAENKHKGTVEFSSEIKQKKKHNDWKDKKKDGDKGGKKPFDKNKFQKTHSKSPYQNRDKSTKESVEGEQKTADQKSGSQLRRAKAKVSDLKKKLMINYNKLIIKKKDQSSD